MYKHVCLTKKHVLPVQSELVGVMNLLQVKHKQIKLFLALSYIFYHAQGCLSMKIQTLVHNKGEEKQALL